MDRPLVAGGARDPQIAAPAVDFDRLDVLKSRRLRAYEIDGMIGAVDDELVRLGGRYAEMYEAWTAHLDPASADPPEVVASGATG